MLKVLSSSLLFGRKLQTLPSRIPPNGEVRYPLLRFFDSLKGPGGRNPVGFRKVCFCSESGDGSEKIIEVKVAEEAAEGSAGDEAESKSNSAIVLKNPRPEDHLTVSDVGTSRFGLFLFFLFFWLPPVELTLVSLMFSIITYYFES